MSNELLSYIPKGLRSSKIFIQMFNAEKNEFDLIESSIEDVNKQLSVDTATWGLAIYEKELGIRTVIEKPLDERRSVIKSKMRGHGSVGSELIKLVVDSYTNGDVEVSFDGKININFTSLRGIPPNMQDVKNALENIKPAHLDVVYVYLFLTWERWDSFNYTWDEIDALNITWDELEVM